MGVIFGQARPTMTSTVAEARRDEALRTALLLRQQGDVEAAIATVRRAVGDDLNDLPLVITLAKLLAEDGQLDKAERWFKRALDLDPDDIDVRVGHATYLGQSGRLEECRATFSQICKDLADELKVPGTLDDEERLDAIGSALAVAGVNLANCALQSGNYDGAVRFASSWLNSAEHWEAAHDIVAGAVEDGDLDADAIAENGLAAGEISPLMMLYLFEQCLEKLDFERMQHLLERGNALFVFDWQRAAPELSEALTKADVAFRRAMMRRELGEDELAAWLAQRSR